MKRLILSLFALTAATTIMAQPVMSNQEAEAKANEIL